MEPSSLCPLPRNLGLCPDSVERSFGLLDRMVCSHIAMHGSVAMSEMNQLINAATLCVRSLDPRVADRAIPASSLLDRRPQVPPLPQRSFEPEEDDGQRIFTFGKYKNRTFIEVYEDDSDYVDWTLKEQDKTGGGCAGMRL